MFDEKTMVELGQIILDMTPEQRQKRAQEISKLLDNEMARRNLPPESSEKKRGRFLQWIYALRRKKPN